MNPRNSAAGTIRQLDPKLAARAPAVDAGAYGIGATEGITFASHWEALDLAARARLPGQRRDQAARRRGRGRGAVPGLGGAPRRADFEIDGVVVKVNDFELQRRLGVVGPRAALGDRLEVPADDEDHAAQGHRVERRQVRRPAPVRRARAGGRGRRDGQARDAPQRGGPRAQGPPRPATRSSCCAPATSSRRSSRPRRTPSSARTARPRPSRPSAARPATRRRSSPRTRSSPSAPTARAARASSGSCSSTSSRAGRWTSRGSARSRSTSSCSAGLVQHAGDLYRLTAEQLVELEGFGEISAQQPASRPIAASKERPFGRVLFAIGIEEVGYVTGRNLAAALPLDRRAAGGDAGADRRDPGRRRRRWPRSIHDQLADEQMRALIADLRALGLQLRAGGRRRRARARWPDKTFVLTGTLPDADARGGDRADPRRRRAA